MIGVSPRTIHRARDRGRRGDAVLQRDDQDRRRRARRSTTCASARSSSPASPSRSSTCATTRTTSSPPSCSARCARSRRTSSRRKRYRGVAPGTRIGASGIEYSLRPLPARQGRLHARSSSTRSATATSGARPRAWSPSRATSSSSRSTSTSSAAANNALRRAIAAAAVNGAKAGAYVAMDPRNGEVLALGSYPSFDANVFAKPLSQRKYDQLNSEARGAPLFNRAIAGDVSDRLDLQAGDRDGGAGGGPDHAELDDRRRRRVQARPAGVPNAKDAVFGPLQLRRALTVSSDVFFYELGAQANAQGPDHPGLGAPARHRPPDGDRHPGRVRAASCPTPSGATRATTSTSSAPRRPRSRPAPQAALFACGGIERPWSAGDNVNLAVGQGDLQATPLQIATAYCTVANGGRVVRPHLGQAVEDGQGRLVQQIRKPAPAQGRVLRGQPRRRSWTACAAPPPSRAAPRPTSSRASRYPVYGKTGTAERGAEPRPVLVRGLRPAPDAPDRGRHDRSRSGGFGAETAAPAARLILAEWFHLNDRELPRGAPARRDERHRPPSSRPPSRRPRSCRGSGACAWTRCCCWPRSASSPRSLIALNGATADDIAGQPHYYVYRQADLRRHRARAHVRRLAAGLLAAARAALPALRADDRARARRARRSRTATRGAKSWIPLPVFNFQPSELGKVLLVRRAGGLRGRPRCARWAARRPRGSCCSALIPTMLVMAEPDLGSALVYVAGDAGHPVRGRRAVAALRRARRAVRGGDHARARRGCPAARRRGAQALPGGPPDVVPAPVGQPGRGGLPAAAVQDRHRLGREDRPRRGERHPDVA